MIKHENKPDGATHYIQGALYDPSYIQYLKKVEGGYSPWSYMREQWMHTVTVKTIAKYGRAIRVIEDEQVKAAKQAEAAISAELDKLLAIADQLGCELDINIVIDGNQGSFKEGSKAKVSIEYVKR